MINDEPIEITLLVIAALDKLGVRYLLGGSLASSIYGEPRATRDADLVAELSLANVQPLCEMLEQTFYISAEEIEEAIKRKSSFNAIHFDTVFKIDVFISKERLFEQQEFERRTLRLVAQNPERSAYVASVEDIILAKLEWYQQGSNVSDQQWRDIVGMVDINRDRLDVQYLTETAIQLDVLPLVNSLIDVSR